MLGFPIKYHEPVFRPPSEGRSLLIQQTIGCSNNKCTYCNMYRSKSYLERDSKEVLDEIERAYAYFKKIGYFPKKVFLCDGDALGASTENLVLSLRKISELFPEDTRVGVYATAQNMLDKTQEELNLLSQNGLRIAYLGMESGCDKVLHLTVKGNNAKDMIDGCQKLSLANIDVSIICMLGLGGKKFTSSHVEQTARVLSEISPKYLSFLTTMAIEGTPYHRMVKRGFEMLTVKELLTELHDILDKCDFKKNVLFRTNHVSNMYPIGGELNRDKEVILKTLKSWISETPEGTYPPKPAHM